ncbi:MAG: hypothetical protein RR651_03405 [Lysinibacillus sp.]
MITQIEEKATQIYNEKTKIYFEEVIDSYKNKNYRSCVVMLYTVSICDLIFKLKDLSEIHNSNKAKDILTKLSTKKELDPVSSAWETELVKNSFIEAKIIETDVYTHLINLKQIRNLAAHPVIDSTDILYEPKVYETGAMILNMLDGLLTKHPLFMKEVFVPFLGEVARIKDEFPSKTDLEIYLKSKYFKHFNSELSCYIFKNLWKICFIKDGKPESENRKQNIKVLGILYENYIDDLFALVKNSKDYFSNVIDDEIIFKYFILFLQSYPEIYYELESHLKQRIQKFVESKKDLLVQSIFISNSFITHIELLKKSFHHTNSEYWNPRYISYGLESPEIDYLKQHAKTPEEHMHLQELLIDHYAHASTYDSADILFYKCIERNIQFFNLEGLEYLLTQHDANPQCSCRRQATVHIDSINKRIDELKEKQKK